MHKYKEITLFGLELAVVLLLAEQVLHALNGSLEGVIVHAGAAEQGVAGNNDLESEGVDCVGLANGNLLDAALFDPVVLLHGLLGGCEVDDMVSHQYEK